MGRKPTVPDPIWHAPARCDAIRYRTRDDGHREWYWRARVAAGDGARVTRTLGWLREMPRRDLEAVVHRMAAALLQHGAFTNRATTAAGDPRTVSDLLERYLADRKAHVYHGDVRHRPRVKGQITPDTYRKYQVSAGHLIAWLGDLLLTALQVDDLKRYATNRRNNDTMPARSDKTVDNELRLLRFALLFGDARGWNRKIDTNVVDPDPKAHVFNHRTPSGADVRAVLRHLADPFRLAVQIIASCGARSSEITGDPNRPGSGLHVGDVDLRAGVMVLVGKGNRRRDVPVMPELVDRLAQVIEGRDAGELVVQSPADHQARRSRKWPGVYTQELRNAVGDACRAAGVEVFTPQGLRRLVDDRLYDANSDPGTSGEIVGHSPEVALRNYRRAGLTRRRTVMQRAGLGALIAEERTDNVIELRRVASDQRPPPDLSRATVEDLLEELRRRELDEPFQDVSEDADG